jgi:hypothetical protein
MSDEIAIDLEKMPPDVVLFIIGRTLSKNLIFKSKISYEVKTYKNGGTVFNHNAAERTEFFRYAGKYLVASVGEKTLKKVMRTGLFPHSASKLYTKVCLFEMEAAAQFLLSHTHSAQRIADAVLPTALCKSDKEIGDSESAVAEIMSKALAAAKELNLAGMTSIIQTRKECAEQKLAELKLEL